MPSLHFTEDTLVQRTTADYLRDVLGWEVVYAYNDESFGAEGTQACHRPTTRCIDGEERRRLSRVRRGRAES